MEKTNAWCIAQHEKTNHFYDTYLPYSFHLRMVVQVYKDFQFLLPAGHYPIDDNNFSKEWFTEVIEKACWGHDLIEDTRSSYNDVKEQLGVHAANIIYALTNEKGKNRKERANDKYYEGIVNTPGASFVKICDRIANIQYSKMTKSKMFELYQKEHPAFVSRIGVKYPIMIEELNKLLKNNK